MKTEKPAELRPAATVILTREHEGTLQVYLLRRSSQSGFMGGFYVFPGGVVDPEDREASFWRSHLAETGTFNLASEHPDAEFVRPFVVAAIRETFEEAGVFLVGSAAPEDARNKLVFDLRRAGKLKTGWLKAYAGSYKNPPALADLLPWAHWITPEAMPSRFDTRFFIVRFPKGQTCRPDKTETTHGVWISPRKGLEENLAGRLPLSPPALVILHELCDYPDFQKIRKISRDRKWGRSIMPRLVALENGALLVEPWDPAYDQPKIETDPASPVGSVLPAGAPFSRLWLDKGIWKPVKGHPKVSD